MQLQINQSGCTLTIHDNAGTLTGIYDIEDKTERPSSQFCGFPVNASVDPKNYSTFVSRNTQYNEGAFSSECRGSPTIEGSDPGGYTRVMGLSRVNMGSNQFFGLRIGLRTVVNGKTWLRVIEYYRS